MASKKYTFFTGILCLFGLGSFAQVGAPTFTPPVTGYDVTDSSLISKKNLPQHNEFVNNAYPFPARPKNQWEIGVKGGMFTVVGDVPAQLDFGFGAHVRKALGYLVSLRLEYVYGMSKGINYKPRVAGFSDPILKARGSTVTGVAYDNFKTTVQDLSLEAVFSLNNIRFNKDKSNVLVYALAGVGGTIYDTKVNALGSNNQPYNFSSIQGGNYKNRKDTRTAIKNLMDNSYESAGETNNEGMLFSKPFTPTASAGVGIAFRLGKNINLAIEDRVSLAFTDLLDGQRWQNTNGLGNSRILTPANDIYNYGTVGLNFNLGSKRVEPLWWSNPLDYAYNEINAPKHMKLPKPILDDADGDGVTDQFDREPNTPANAPVDTHGVSRDTDGDGVPDYKDKELVTPTQCQPVDADGVGKCPEPACCQTLDSLMKSGSFGKGNCNLGALPSVSFTGRSATLSNDAKAVLTSVAEKLRNSPNCRIAVVGYGASSKSVQQMSWDRVNNVINYLVEKEGISTDRFIFKYGEEGGDMNTVDLREATTDDVPNSVPAPHPNLRKK